MNSVITEMLRKYDDDRITDKKNALKEVMQEIVLCDPISIPEREHKAAYASVLCF